jgi:biopolymer transport protein ExbD
MSRSGRVQRHHEDNPPLPRVPVIPMLDMAFQLLSFGLYCFDLNEDKVEGQMTMSLPKSGADTPSPSTSDKIDEPEEEFTVRVKSDGGGRVGEIELTSTKMTDAVALPKEADKLAADLKGRVEKKLEAKEPAPKLDMQFDPELNYQVVFELLSAADTARFKKISPNLLTAPKPKEPPK